MVSTSESPLLELKEISLEFGGVKALQGVSFNVEPGQIQSIIGPNGAGKSTLLNCVSGVYRPKGSILFKGTDLIRRPPHERMGLGIARTFQNIALFQEESVLDNVLSGGHHRLQAGMLRGCLYWTRFGCVEEERRLRSEAFEALVLLGMEDARDNPVRDLPYGAQKRVELARAMLARPSLLLLDEPMAGMNQSEKREFSAHVRRLNQERDVTVLMIEHDVGVVREISDRVIVLDFGRKIAEGLPQEVMKEPAVRKAYLGEEGDKENPRG